MVLGYSHVSDQHKAEAVEKIAVARQIAKNSTTAITTVQKKSA